MSLDNFVSSKPKKKSPPPKKSKKKSTKKPSKKATGKKVPEESAPLSRFKFKLSCTASCKYSKILRKRELTPEDYICPKCGKKMKEKKV